MTDLTQRVNALDEQILRGEISGAAETFFHDDVCTREGNSDEVSTGKAQKLSQLQEFLGSISSVNRIERHAVADRGDVTFSEFTFDLMRDDGGHILWNEVIRRVWKDGLVIDERYYIAE